MNPELALVLFFMCIFLFQLFTKIAIDCENAGDCGSPVYGLSVSGALFSVIFGSRVFYELAVDVERGLQNAKA